MRWRPLALLVPLACDGTLGVRERNGGIADDRPPAGGDADADADSDADDDSDADADLDGGTRSGIDPWAGACPWAQERDYARPSDAFFDGRVLLELGLEMDDGDWSWLLANPDLEEYRPAALIVCGERFDGVGLRFKKSTHPDANLEEGYPKNPMVIDMSEFAPGQKLRGLRHVDLEYGGDQMLVAERMNWEALAGSGLEVSRVGSVLLSVNGVTIGVFTNVERVDRSFALEHFGDDEGNLYKHSYCGTFEREDDPAEYLRDPRCYEKKTNEEEADYSDLLHVIEVLNETPAEDLESALPAVLDVDGWIPLMASLQALGYGDTPNANANNFFTYDSATTGRFEIIPWDLDGGFWSVAAPCEHPADTVRWGLFRIASCYQSLPLFHRVVERPSWRERYLDAVRDFVDGPFAPESYALRVAELVALLEPGLAVDGYRDGDDADWAASIEQLVRLQAERVGSVREQLEAEGH